MTEVRGLTPGVGYTPQDIGAALSTAQGAGVDNVDTAKLLSELAKLSATLQSQSPGGTPGVTNSNGAPAISGVTINFSPEDMAAALLVLQGKTQEAQLTTAREGLTANKKKLEEKNEQAMQKINDWIKKCEEAASKEKAAGIFGWIVKIASFIAAALAVAVAAVATVATGGAAAPLLALAIVGMIGATMSLASQISQSAGGPALDIGTLMVKACTGILKACGVPADKAESFGKLMAGMAVLVSPALLVADPSLAGHLVGGIAELAGADADKVAIISAVATAVAAIAVSIVMIVATGGAAAPAAIGGVAKTIMAAAKIGQAVAGIAGGAAAVTQGGLNIAKAHDERDAANMQADKKTIDALIAKLQKQMEEDREEIKKVLDQIMEGMNIVSQMINAAAQTRTQISSNLVGKGQTI